MAKRPLKPWESNRDPQRRHEPLPERRWIETLNHRQRIKQMQFKDKGVIANISKQ